MRVKARAMVTFTRLSLQMGMLRVIHMEVVLATKPRTPRGHITTWGGVGGWGYGDPGCASCYLYYENNQSIAAQDGVDYVFSGVGEVFCSLVGAFFYQEFPDIYLSIAKTKEKTTDMTANTYCPSVPICTVTPRCSVASVYEGSNAPCDPAHWCEFLAEKSSPTGSATCFINVCFPTADTSVSSQCTPAPREKRGMRCFRTSHSGPYA